MTTFVQYDTLLWAYCLSSSTAAYNPIGTVFPFDSSTVIDVLSSFKELLPVLGDHRQYCLLPRPRLRHLHPRASNQVLPLHEHPRFRHRRR